MTHRGGWAGKLKRLARGAADFAIATFLVLGIAFTMTSIWMKIFGIGRSPLNALIIGAAFLSVSYLLLRATTKPCPRCGSFMVEENGKCGVCDYKLDEK